MTEKQLTRLGERFIRLHYDLYDIARRLDADGRDAYAETAKDLARRLARFGNTLIDGGKPTP